MKQILYVLFVVMTTAGFGWFCVAVIREEYRNFWYDLFRRDYRKALTGLVDTICAAVTLVAGLAIIIWSSIETYKGL